MKRYLLALAALVLGAGCLLSAADGPKPEEPKQKVRVTNTQRVDFPPGGTLRVRNSIGVLTVEAWDRPDVEITTIKSTRVELDARGREEAPQKLERVHVTAERHGNEVIVTTRGGRHFELEYHIKAPVNARLIDNHHSGDVNVDGLTSDIDVTLRQGQITLHLPEDGQYRIHAKSNFGSVNSDFSPLEKRRWWLLGRQSVRDTSPAQHNLNLKVGFGDIVLLRTRIPKAPESMLPARQQEGL